MPSQRRCPRVQQEVIESARTNGREKERTCLGGHCVTDRRMCPLSRRDGGVQRARSTRINLAEPSSASSKRSARSGAPRPSTRGMVGLGRACPWRTRPGLPDDIGLGATLIRKSLDTAFQRFWEIDRRPLPYVVCVPCLQARGHERPRGPQVGFGDVEKVDAVVFQRGLASARMRSRRYGLRPRSLIKSTGQPSSSSTSCQKAT